jgi:hypothetical protein
MGGPAGDAIRAQQEHDEPITSVRSWLRPRRVPKAATTTPVLGNSEPKMKANLKQMILLLLPT